MSEFVNKNIVFVGDGSVGKTSLLYAFKDKGGYRISYVPTIYDMDKIELELDNVRHFIKLHDTAGEEDYERLRRIRYDDADCFVLCYSISNRASFRNILSKWYPELRPFGLPIVLVATKNDLTTAVNLVQTEEGERMKRKINANRFLECSAKQNYNVNEVIDEAVRAINMGRPDPAIGASCWCCAGIMRKVFCCGSNC